MKINIKGFLLALLGRNNVVNAEQVMPIDRDEAPKQNTEVRLIRVRDAAAKMCVSVSFVYREIKAGNLGPLIKVGNHRSALNADHVDRWIAEKVRVAYQGDSHIKNSHTHF